MLLVLFPVIVGILIFLFIYFSEDGDGVVALGGSGVAFFVCILLSALILSIISADKDKFDIEYQTVKTVDILCFEDNNNTEEPYYLLSGTEENLYYYYMYDEYPIGKATDRIPAKNSYIKYTNENFRIETINTKYKNRFVGFWLGADWFLEDIYVVYIPEGSITAENNYNIDFH